MKENGLAKKLVKKMYYKLLMLKFLPEIKAIENSEIKAI
jgi:hypothetical protein